MRPEFYEHDDLEEKFQLSASVEFSFTEEDYKGLEPFEIKIKKKQEKKIQVENVELRKSKSGGLF